MNRLTPPHFCHIFADVFDRYKVDGHSLILFLHRNSDPACAHELFILPQLVQPACVAGGRWAQEDKS